MDYPSNSTKKRPTAVKDEPKKIERVIESEVVRRKRPLGKKFKDIFIGGDAKSVWGHVLMNRLIPAAQDAVIDAGQEALQQIILGDSRAVGTLRMRRANTAMGNANYTNYTNYSKETSSRHGKREDPRNVSRKARATHNFDEIILPTRAEAEEVIDRLFDLVANFEVASVTDLYAMLGVEADYTDNKYGWEDLRGAGVTRVHGGYLLDLPKPEPID